MPDFNYAEYEHLLRSKDAPLEMCFRQGGTHAAYGWSCTPDGAWDENQRRAYSEGYAEQREKMRQRNER